MSSNTEIESDGRRGVFRRNIARGVCSSPSAASMRPGPDWGLARPHRAQRDHREAHRHDDDGHPLRQYVLQQPRSALPLHLHVARGWPRPGTARLHASIRRRYTGRARAEASGRKRAGRKREQIAGAGRQRSTQETDPQRELLDDDGRAGDAAHVELPRSHLADRQQRHPGERRHREQRFQPSEVDSQRSGFSTAGAAQSRDAGRGCARGGLSGTRLASCFTWSKRSAGISLPRRFG